VPTQDSANVTVETIHGTHVSIGGLIQTFIRSVDNGTEIFSINVFKQSVGNNFTALITYEQPPAPP
jgi:hypothetical protein